MLNYNFTSLNTCLHNKTISSDISVVEIVRKTFSLNILYNNINYANPFIVIINVMIYMIINSLCMVYINKVLFNMPVK